MKIEETLRNLGLTNGEVKVYLSLVDIGSTTVGPIIDRSGVSNSKVYVILDKLIKKGIASYIIKGKTKYFQASSPKHLSEILEKKQEKIDLLKKSLNKTIKYIEERSEYSKEESKIYKGYKGIKSAWIEATKTIPNKGQYLFFSKGYGEDITLKTFFKNLSTELKERKIKILGLANVEEKENYDEFYKRLGYNMKYTNFNWPADTTIAGDYLLLLVWDKKNPVVYSIQSKILVESYKIFFESIWN